MTSKTLFRLGGWAAILSGGLLLIDTLIIELLLPTTILTSSIGHFAVISGFFAIIAIYLWQREESGTFGGIAFIINYLGLAYLSGAMFFTNYVAPYLSQSVRLELRAGPPKVMFLASALLFEIGVILFGIASVRAGKFPRLAAVFYTVGYTAFVIEAFVPTAGIISWVIRAFQCFGGVGVIWMGYALVSRQHSSHRRAGTLQSPSV